MGYFFLLHLPSSSSSSSWTQLAPYNKVNSASRWRTFKLNSILEQINRKLTYRWESRVRPCTKSRVSPYLRRLAGWRCRAIGPGCPGRLPRWRAALEGEGENRLMMTDFSIQEFRHPETQEKRRPFQLKSSIKIYSIGIWTFLLRVGKMLLFFVFCCCCRCCQPFPSTLRITWKSRAVYIFVWINEISAFGSAFLWRSDAM